MNLNDKDNAAIPCRLCGNEAGFYGRKTLRGRYDVAYYECRECLSLQTEQPYWIEEAYQVEGLDLDVGACQRSVNLSLEVAACLTVLGISGEELCLDYGSGLGLFSRLMRDRGFNFHAYDKFIRPFFMDRFLGVLPNQKWRVLTAFEVFEHMVSPGSECADLFQADPDMIFFTTQLWERQGLDWWYFAPHGGQHIFFHSAKGLKMLGDRHGFTFFDLKRVKLLLNNRIAKENRPLSTLEKTRYRFVKGAIRKGASLPADIPTRLHVLRDGKTMRELARHLFLRHQDNSFQWIDRDFARLNSAASGAE